MLSRHRLWYLLATLVLGIGAGLADQLLPGPLGYVLPLGALLLSVILLVAVVTVMGRPMPLVARPAVPSFDFLPGPAQVLLTGALTLQQGSQTTKAIVGSITGAPQPWEAFDLILRPFALAVLIVLWTVVLRGMGLRLRPDGVHDRRLLGSVFVPWDAFGPDVVTPATATKLPLQVARPDRVVRQGYYRGEPSARVSAADRGRIGALLRMYAADPAARTGIGHPDRLPVPAGD